MSASSCSAFESFVSSYVGSFAPEREVIRRMLFALKIGNCQRILRKPVDIEINGQTVVGDTNRRRDLSRFLAAAIQEYRKTQNDKQL